MTDTYKKAVNLLTSKEKFHIELGLDRISSVLACFDNPQNKFKAIHVAGTNGKGSVCSILSKVLEKAGYKVGLYTSPHLTKYTERIQINNTPINDEKFYDLICSVEQICHKTQVYLTEFEILTAAGFLYFAEEKVDIAVIEVGLGGRLDATNVIEEPILEVITSISLDHTDRLGNTIELIAAEKAGIIKPNSTCIISENNLGFNTVSQAALKQKGELLISPIDIELKIIDEKTYAVKELNIYEFALSGAYQAENLSLALCAIKALIDKGFNISQEAVILGLREVRHRGRFEHFKAKNIIIDGAHNPDGAKALRLALNNLFPNQKIIFVYASINTKDYKNVLNILLKEHDEIYFYNFQHANSVKIETLAKCINKVPQKINNIEELEKLALFYKNENIPVVFTGSLYAISEFYEKNSNNL